MYCVPMKKSQKLRSQKSEVEKSSSESQISNLESSWGILLPICFVKEIKPIRKCRLPGLWNGFGKITGNDDEDEDDTYKNLQKILDFCCFYASHFILSMGGMFFEFPFNSRFLDFTINFSRFLLCFSQVGFVPKELDFFLNLGILICFHLIGLGQVQLLFTAFCTHFSEFNSA